MEISTICISGLTQTYLMSAMVTVLFRGDKRNMVGYFLFVTSLGQA